jgi:MoxR-like ATPase
MAPPVLRHRIKTNFNADAEGLTADAIIQRLLEAVPHVDEREGTGGKQPTVFRSADAG